MANFETSTRLNINPLDQRCCYYSLSGLRNGEFMMLYSRAKYVFFEDHRTMADTGTLMQSQLDPLPNDLPFRIISKTIGRGAYAS